MAIRIVRLGSARQHGEGLRIGTVRRPPRGVPKHRYGEENWFDVWYPNLSPSPVTIKLVQGEARQGDVWERQWAKFEKLYRAEMAQPTPSHTLNLLAALSQTADFSVGCYCEDESRCHRSILRKLLVERGANVK